MKAPEIKIPQINQPKKVEENPNFEAETKQEINEYHQKLRAQTNAEKDGIDKATSTGFYFCVYFADTEQKDEFIANAGLTGQNIGQYFNGEKFAETLGVKLKKKKIANPKVFRRHKNLQHFVK